MKKIAFVTHYDELYGANRSLISLIDGLQSYGVQSYVIAPKQGPITEELSKRDTPFYTLPFKKWMSHNRWKSPARLGLNLALLPFLARKVRQWDVDLVHTNSSVTPIGALIAEVLGLPHTWHVREFGDLHYNMRHDWGEPPFRLLMSRSAAAIAVSESVRDHVLSGIDVPSFVVYNGVISKKRLEQLSRERKSKKESSSQPYTFAIVGQISPEKGQKQALRALCHLKQKGKECRLLVAGSGANEHVESLQDLRRELNLENDVSLLGYVPDPFRIYQKSESVLMCSSHEAMGRVTAEAMALGRPVIGHDSGGTVELVDDGDNGLLYDGTTKGLANCMQRLIDNPGLAHSLGQNGQDKARLEYTNEAYTQKFYSALSESLKAF